MNATGRRFRRALLCLLVPLLTSLGCSLGQTPEPEFNVVLVVIDTLRADRLAVFNDEVETGPYLEELAASSVVFDSAHTTTSWTTPATASLFTGLYPVQHGLWTGFRASTRSGAPHNRIPDAAETIPEMMERIGYRTFGVADNINIDETAGFARGFGRFEKHLYKAAKVLDGVVQEWESEILDGGKYFLYLHFMDPHSPYRHREPWFREGSSREHLRRLIAWERGAGGGRGWSKTMLDRYDSEIGYVDAILGGLHERLGWDRNTLVIVLSDHGEEFYDHDDRKHGASLYQEVMRIPLMVYFPGRFASRRIADPVSIVDVLPTLRELMADKTKPLAAGRSLVPLLEGSPARPRPVFGMFRHETPDLEVLYERQAILAQNWKFVRHTEPLAEELFHLDDDPYEQRNAIRERPEAAAKLRAELDRFLAEAPRLDRSFAEGVRQTDEATEHLRALGYVN